MFFSFSLLQNVQPKAQSPGVSQEGQAGANQPSGASGGGLLSLLPLLMFVPLLFMMFRRQKKEQQQRAKLKKGDAIVSNSGLIGELVEMDGKISKVKIAPGTTVQMVTHSISPLEVGKEKKGELEKKPESEENKTEKEKKE